MNKPYKAWNKGNVEHYGPRIPLAQQKNKASIALNKLTDGMISIKDRDDRIELERRNKLMLAALRSEVRV